MDGRKPADEDPMRERMSNQGGFDTTGDEMAGLDPIDLKILSSLRAIREEAAPSVAGEVMARLAARRRRVTALRWATAVGAAFLAGLGVNALGPALWGYMYGFLLHGNEAGVLAALAQTLSILRDVLATVVQKLVQGAVGYDLGPYATQIWTAVLGAAVAVLLMMYLMGRWLGKPKEGKSWLLRRTMHNGLQVF
jgi:hypothetical protein